MATTLDRDDIITGLRELIAELRAEGEVAGIRLVGGAALSLRYFDRGTTQDLDSLHVRPGSDAAVASAAARVAQRHDWDPTWLNFEVTKADALPTLGRAVEWDTIYDRDDIVIQVASKEALLAMKLRANRPGRDTRDIRLLLSLCEISSLDDADELYEEFYPGDTLDPRAVSMVTAILADGKSDTPERPKSINF
ncbi:Nucleotidyltransferase AbiEii toxin of type IV toxin-antitoxin system [Salinibacterium sp. NYA9b]